MKGNSLNGRFTVAAVYSELVDIGGGANASRESSAYRGGRHPVERQFDKLIADFLLPISNMVTSSGGAFLIFNLNHKQLK